jgi:hypothetical protein
MRPTLRPLAALSALCCLLSALPLEAQQAADEEYGKKIREFLRDPRITTELVDHLPASSTVPSPLKFHGRIVGTPGELTYAKDIHRYFRALDDASDRVLTWSIGETEEGREMIVLAVADEATIRDLQRYKGMLNALGDPRKTSEADARKLIAEAKPMYWLTSGMHSPENGGPEMLMELAYRLAVQETPFIRTIRDNVITLITPVIEVDGREKQVDTWYFNKKRPAATQRLPLMYWGKYVAHDNNRDAMGQFLALTRNVNRFWLDWTPTIMHDLHESATYLYSSTGTGPYNEALDPITISEWWTLAQVDVMELTKRGVPGVWTYGFYDGWVPNYMFFVAHAHNGTGRFYEVQSYGPDNYVVRPGATTTSREWFRPNPPLDSISWGPRNNTNIQQSGVLVSLHDVAKNRATWVENWWLKNQRSVEKGRTGPVAGWVIPAGQRRKADAADAVNDLRRQGLEFHVAQADFTAGKVSVKAGDWIVRADQPYRTLADMYFAVQNYPVTNPRPYDDTGWTFQLMRNIVIHPITDRGLLDARMAPLTDDARAAGGISGTGPVVVVDHTADNNLVALRYRFAQVKMTAAEADFEVAGRKFRAGAFIIAEADRAALDAALRELGLSGVAMAKAPEVKAHDLDLPRIGYVHSWANTQNEGWVRAALDTYGIPYTYFADQKLREGNLRARYDVIIFPHVGGTAQSQVNGIAKIDTIPLPYRKTDATPNLGFMDQSDDIRGGMGLEGLAALRQFVEEGGTLITEGATATIFPEYGLTTGVTVERPANLFVRGSIVRGVVADRKHPIAYGFDAQVPVYFNQDPVLAVGGGGFGGFGGPAAAGSQNITPMATRLRVSPWVQEGDSARAPEGRPAPAAGQGGGSGGQFGQQGPSGPPPRAVLRFPAAAADILLSGTLAGGEAITNRAQIVDAPLGKGHVVMFAIRPFWRWQTQGNYFFGFNAILHWNDLNAGR